MKSATPQSTGSTLRRGGRVLAVAMVLLVAVGLLALVTACGGSSGSSNASPSTGAIKMGGVLKIGSQPGNINFDPALFAGAVPDILLQQQVYELSLIHISEPTRRTPISYAVFCLKKKKK